MTNDCASKLTSFEPVVELLMRAESYADGWKLWVRHRHHAGLFLDCDPFEVSHLSGDELVSVLDTYVWEITARQMSLEQS